MMCSLSLKPSCHVEVVGAKEETKKGNRKSSKPTEIQNLYILFALMAWM